MQVRRVLCSLFVPVLICLGLSAQSGKAINPCKVSNTLVDVELMSPISTSTAKPGDTFVVNIIKPDAMKDAKIEGDVKSLVKAERGYGKGAPHIDLEFNYLTINGQTCSLTGELQDVRNSKGAVRVDEEGRAIGHSSNKKRIAGTLGGALLGGLAGYAAGGGDKIYAGMGAGAVAGFLITSSLTTTGTDISFAPRSTFTLSISGARARTR